MVFDDPGLPGAWKWKVNLILERFFPDVHALFGFLSVNGYTFFTQEAAWREGGDCLPTGSYAFKRTMDGSPTYAIDLNGHSTVIEPRGDGDGIVLGTQLGVVEIDDQKRLAVGQKGMAFRRFMREMAGRAEATIDIRWHGA